MFAFFVARLTVGRMTGTRSIIGLGLFNLLYMLVPNLFQPHLSPRYYYYKHYVCHAIGRLIPVFSLFLYYS